MGAHIPVRNNYKKEVKMVTEIKSKKLDFASIKAEARKEILEEQAEETKEKIKSKLLSINSAKKILRNLERELEDLEAELNE